MEKRPNDFDGLSYFITDPADIERLDPRAKIFLEPVQVNFLEIYPKSLEALIKKAAKITEVPNLAKWLASLWHTQPILEIHTTSDLYDMNAVWLRFPLQKEDNSLNESEWQPAFNLLSYKNNNHFLIPELLTQLWNLTGEINHNGYGTAGRFHHPDKVGEEVTFYETLYSEKAFYHLPDLNFYWEFPGGMFGSEEARQQFGLYLLDEGLPYFLNQYFNCLLNKKELRITRDGDFYC